MEVGEQYGLPLSEYSHYCSCMQLPTGGRQQSAGLIMGASVRLHITRSPRWIAGVSHPDHTAPLLREEVRCTCDDASALVLAGPGGLLRAVSRL